MSDAPGSLAAALAQLQARLPRVTKDTEGQAGTRKIMYADLPTVSDALRPILGELGLVFSCRPTWQMFGNEFKFVLAYALLHVPTGDALEGFYPLPGSATPQQAGSAITYARRYALCAVTGLAPDDGSDDDAQAAEQSYRAMRNAPPEVRADGSATEAEIMRMQRGPEPGVTRHRAADPNDPFYDPSMGGLPEDAPGSINPGQMRAIHMLFKRRGIETDEGVRAECGRILGREVASRGQLSHVDAAAIIAWKEPASAERS
jgi:ERF superfamily